MVSKFGSGTKMLFCCQISLNTTILGPFKGKSPQLVPLYNMFGFGTCPSGLEIRLRSAWPWR